MGDNPVAITSTDFWVEVVEMLQQNWALIDGKTEEGGCTVFFIHDGSGVFDRLQFPSEAEAASALRRNGLARYAESPDAQKFISSPRPPFVDSRHANGPIYSSGRFWSSPAPASPDGKRRGSPAPEGRPAPAMPVRSSASATGWSRTTLVPRDAKATGKPNAATMAMWLTARASGNNSR